MAQADGADPGQQPHPVLNQNEQEQGDEQGEGGGKGFLANDRLKEIAQSFDERLEDRLAFGREDLGFADHPEDDADQDDRDRPAGRHAVGNGPAMAEIDQFGGGRRHAATFAPEGGDGKGETGKGDNEFLNASHGFPRMGTGG